MIVEARLEEVARVAHVQRSGFYRYYPDRGRHGPRDGAQVGHAPGGRVRRAWGRPGLFRGRLGVESVRASDERLALLDRLHDCRM